MTTQFVGITPTSSGTATANSGAFQTLCTLDVSSLIGVNCNNCSFFVRAHVVGHAASGNLVVFELQAAFRRDAGVMAQVGTTNITNQYMDLALLTAGIDLASPSNTQIRLRASGVGGQSIAYMGAMALTTSPI